MQMTDNAGATDHHRALNYLAMRDRRIYEAVAEAYGRNESLSAVDVLLSPLSGARKIMDVIFSFTDRRTGVVSKQVVSVDMTGMYPFLHRPLRPYYDR
jgi:PatG C-terminal